MENSLTASVLPNLLLTLSKTIIDRELSQNTRCPPTISPEVFSRRSDPNSAIKTRLSTLHLFQPTLTLSTHGIRTSSVEETDDSSFQARPCSGKIAKTDLGPSPTLSQRRLQPGSRDFSGTGS